MEDTKPRIIAIDIDDVTSDTHGAVKEWAHRSTGVALDPRHYHTDDPYWDYYNTIWRRHGLDKLDFDAFLYAMSLSQDNIPVIADAARVIKDLNERFGVVFITSRDPILHDTTRAWLNENIDPSIPLYLAHNPLANELAVSKADLCVDLGIKYLIDDSIDNCQNVEGVGVQSILFGDFGWNRRAPESLTRCLDWQAVENYFDGRE